MRPNDSHGERAEIDGRNVSRRRLLQATGVAGVAGFAGCVSETEDNGNGGGNGNGGDDGEIGTVTFGVLSPVSGGFSPQGGPQRQGAETAVEYINESDEFDFEIEAVYEDTETEPSVGRRRAQRVVEEDEAEYIVGAVNSAVALAISEYAASQEVIYTSGGAAMELTEEECNAYTFRNETNTAQQASGLSEWILEEGYENVWIHTADYAYGNSAVEEIEASLEGEDVEIIGATVPSLGTDDFGPYISQISNSDADVLAIPLTGGDLIDFIGQADSAGLKDDVDIIGTANFARVVRNALGPAVADTYSAALYDADLEVGDNEQFVSHYEEMHDELPDAFSRVGYEAVRMTARGIQEAGTSNPSEVKDVLPDVEMETILGTTHFRDCDHQSANPVWPSEIVLPDEDAEMTELNILSEIPPEETTPDCSGNCEM
ncbi:ABC transporter substrate-binding protein [Natrialba swarupiae]|uniref:ABC transporter substrate-binding protein n=1 Tax=Natrialba swarupiae TaxID=2448032 RepID=A0A5D5ANU9_9EURY|nr:ABC transporter substrate-binding protein [Natrialba swarupiae]TYT62597.1 ABC transporter substrate-binding protein [Natrialba swarupiae]